MAAGGVSSVKSVKTSQGIAESLAFAVLEWLLMLLLFISGLISYLVTKFACYCGLEIPCLLCSRLDHVFGKEKLGFYWDMICKNHKSEISAMVLCHAHSNLVDVHGLCENCLFSFATINKSNAETYRLLVGKLGADEESLSDGCGSNTKLCHCCSQPWVSRGHAKRLIRTTSIDVPLGTIEHVEDTIKSIENEDKPSRSGEDLHQKNREIDPLPHVGYTELKITSDTESDALFSDDDETGVLMIGSKVDVSIDLAAMEPLVSVSHKETNLEQIVEEASAEDSAAASSSSSLSLPEMKIDAVEVHMDIFEVPATGHGLEEINWQNSPSIVPELISFDDFPLSKNDDPIPTLVKTEPNPLMTAPSGSDAILEVETETITTTEKPTEENVVSSSSSPKVPNLLDLGDAYELAISSRGRELTGVLAEQLLEKDSDLRNSLGSKEDVSIELAVMEPLVSVPHDVTNSGQIVEEASGKNPSPLPVRVPHDETNSGQIVEEASAEDSSSSSPLPLPEMEVDVAEVHKDVYEVPAAGDGSEEINRQTSESKPPSPVPELISFDDFPSSTNDDPSPTLVKLPSESYVAETNGSGSNIITVEVEPNPITITTTEKPTEGNFVSTAGSSPRVPNLLELGDAYRLAISSRGRQLSGVLAEQWLVGKDSPRVSEDLRILLSQLSASRGFECSVSDLSPKRIRALERNESNVSYDGSVVSEVEGESAVDRLKRQIEHDRRAMRALHRELEEERNAAAVAANQAMAMITRLQEEKAALQMEALQYLRVMEEQEEYDSEALQKSNELLAEREKEIQDLEDELEFYRNNNSNGSPFSENAGGTFSDKNVGPKTDFGNIYLKQGATE